MVERAGREESCDLVARCINLLISLFLRDCGLQWSHDHIHTS